MNRILAAALALALSACATVNQVRVATHPRADSCEATEARPSPLSSISYVVCWDRHGKAIGMASGESIPTAQIPLDLVGPAALGATGVVLSRSLKDIAPQVSIPPPSP